uniref:Reverse transcriptase domain-containing protein n=1 Tax=Xenopus tropicalis TaxID=8364 RepID=A0A803JRB9_XENTR
MYKFIRSLKLKAHFATKDNMTKTDTFLVSLKNKLGKKSSFVPPGTFTAIDTFEAVVMLEINKLMSNKDSYMFRKGSNISRAERQAIKSLQHNTSIIIMRADKGGGTVVLNKNDYESEALRQLENQTHYRKLDGDPTAKFKNELNIFLNAAVMEGVITEELYQLIFLQYPKVPNIYFLPKVHKSLVNPPGRPIVSNVGALWQPPAILIDMHLQELLPNLEPSLKDTTDFLNRLNKVIIPEGEFILCSLDVKDLFTSIPHVEGIECVRQYLTKANQQMYKVNFLCDLLEMVLTRNYFGFNDEYFIQLQGCAMGANMAPAYANIFMDNFEKIHIFSNTRYQPFIHSYMRYVDDTFFLWTGTVDLLNDFLIYLNNVHTTIKFTLEVGLTEIHFLDVLVKVTDSNFVTSIYRKPTDKNNLLRPNSFHPQGLFRGLPKSQFMRIKRIASTNEVYEDESQKMVQKFVEKGYCQLDLMEVKREVGLIPRNETLKMKGKAVDKVKRIPFITSYDINAKARRNIILKHWGILATDPKFGHLFKLPPIFSYRRGRNIGELIKHRPGCSSTSTITKGTFPCRNCSHCNGIIAGSAVTHPQYGTRHEVGGFYTCDSKDVIYCVKCPCGLAYVGQTSRPVKMRLNEHKSTIRNYKPPTQSPQRTIQTVRKKEIEKKRETLLAKHFFTHGHQVAQVRWQILEKIQVRQGQDKKKLLSQRECYWIWLLQSRHPRGLNDEFNMACFL